MNKVVYSSSYMFELSDRAIEWLIAHGKTEEWCHEVEHNYAFRKDLILVECVEILGAIADTDSSDLRIAKIEGDTYAIFDNGQNEYVLTPDDVEWITIK